jgi:hypothetical protein
VPATDSERSRASDRLRDVPASDAERSRESGWPPGPGMTGHRDWPGNVAFLHRLVLAPSGNLHLRATRAGTAA